MPKLRGICAGAGYFSRFHLDAWQRIDEAEIVGMCDLNADKAQAAADEFGIPRHGTQLWSMVDELSPDFVDIATPPATHLELVREASNRGLAILCQKPLAPTLAEARQLVAATQDHQVRLMVHENFRFQPWYREIKQLLDQRVIGETLFSITFRSRLGDGWGDDAYLNRQPYFRDMPQLLVYETGVHFIDTFRYLAGEIDGVYAALKRLNPVIRGEDRALLVFHFASGALGVWDANRYNECNHPDPRYTFGEMLVEGSGGTIRLYLDGRLTIQPLGEPEREHNYVHERRGFAGDCVHATLKHFVQCLISGTEFETHGVDYLRTLCVQDAVYESAQRGEMVRDIQAR
jgi:predicted dehydrogenase